MWPATAAFVSWSTRRLARALLGSRQLVERAIASGQTIYGINTGFGKLANVRVAPDQLDQLQINLIRSHAAGVGDPLPAAVVRAVMLLRANVLLRPTSGVRPELVDALVAMLNAGVVPLVPEQGSVGASGDLAPLSHIALALMGEGEVLGGEGRGARAAGARGRAGSRPSVSRRRKGSRSSTGPRRRRRCWRFWCTTHGCSGVPPSARPR